MTRDSNRAVWLQQARSHLRHADPVLTRLINDRPDFDPRAWLAQLPPMDLFGALLFQVTGQQLSGPRDPPDPEVGSVSVVPGCASGRSRGVR